MLDSVAIPKKTAPVPAKATMIRLPPLASPSTAPSRRESIRPMNRVKANNIGTPAAEFLVFSMANMKPKAPAKKTSGQSRVSSTARSRSTGQSTRRERWEPSRALVASRYCAGLGCGPEPTLQRRKGVRRSARSDSWVLQARGIATTQWSHNVRFRVNWRVTRIGWYWPPAAVVSPYPVRLGTRPAPSASSKGEGFPASGSGRVVPAQAPRKSFHSKEVLPTA